MNGSWLVTRPRLLVSGSWLVVSGGGLRERRISPPLARWIAGLLLGQLDRGLRVLSLRLEDRLRARAFHGHQAAVLGAHVELPGVLRVPGQAVVILALDVDRDVHLLAVEVAALHFLLLIRLLDRRL